jgi:hypothetical protein
LRGAITSDVKLSDCRFAFKQLLGREGEPLGSPLVSFSDTLVSIDYRFASPTNDRTDKNKGRYDLG